MPGFWIDFSRGAASRFLCQLFALPAIVAMGLASGCGSGGTGSPSPTNSSGATSSVTVLVSSTANDQLSKFNLQLTGLTLTNQAGKTLTVFSGLQNFAEFIHLNGTVEPLITANVPQDTYTSATATVGGAQFTCITAPSNGGLDNTSFAYGQTPANQVTVTLATPILVTGTAVGLTLDLQVSPSATYNSCADTEVDLYSINPTFALTAFDLTSPAAGSNNTTGIGGFVATVDASTSTFTVTPPDAPILTVKSNAGTIFQGIAGLDVLAAGMPVNLDGTVQADGSLMASRVGVSDTNASYLSVASGPVLFVSGSQPTLFMLGREQQGILPQVIGSQAFSFGNAVFQISGALTNLDTLPFQPSFTAADIAPGLNIAITSHATTIQGGPVYVPADTVTLMPLTIDGIVTAASSSGGFQMYTVQLAPYDLLPDLAVQAGQKRLLSNPDMVTVYVDSHTLMSNAAGLVPGAPFRFYGLLFNDQGTLRMDCARVNDGVPE